jgi:RNA polymerase sigma-70 factor (ECF subfamily)
MLSRRGFQAWAFLEAAIQSVHAERARSGLIDWKAIAWFYEQLNRLAPTIGRRTGYAAALAEANGGLAILDAIDQDAVSNYQPYWAVRPHLLQLLGKSPEAQHVYDRATGLAKDPAVRKFLIQKRADFFCIGPVEISPPRPSPR